MLEKIVTAEWFPYFIGAILIYAGWAWLGLLDGRISTRFNPRQVYRRINSVSNIRKVCGTVFLMAGIVQWLRIFY